VQKSVRVQINVKGTSKQKLYNIQFNSEISHKEQKYPLTSEILRQSPRYKAKLGRRNVFFLNTPFSNIINKYLQNGYDNISISYDYWEN